MKVAVQTAADHTSDPCLVYAAERKSENETVESLTFYPFRISSIRELFGYWAGARRCIDIQQPSAIIVDDGKAVPLDGHAYVFMIDGMNPTVLLC